MRTVLLTMGLTALAVMCGAEGAEPLVLEAKIELPAVRGRIDHLAIDVEGQRLFVAALGNDTVEVIDLAKRTPARTLQGFHEPQGVAYVAATKTLYVASGGDGTLRGFRGDELTPSLTLELGSDADNVRIDAGRKQIYVGYGDGALAVIDQDSHARVADTALRGHPESFQLEQGGSRIFVNVPDSGEIAVVDRETRRQIARWPTGDLHANYPMALDQTRKRVLAVFRKPAVLAIFDFATGQERARIPICGDADDIFVDDRRNLLYVSCGEGFVDVLAATDDAYTNVARVKTVAGARTALYSGDLGRLFVAARATGAQPAAVWIFRTRE